MVVTLPMVSVVPFAVALVTVKVLLSGSMSFVRMFPVIVCPFGAALASSLAFTSFVAFAGRTVIRAEAEAVPPFPSEIV